VRAQVEVPDPEIVELGAERLDGSLGEDEVLEDGEVRQDGRLLVDRDHATAPGLTLRSA
jgi:hypothetical protein